MEGGRSSQHERHRDADRTIQIRLLGGVSAANSTGEPLDIGPAKCQTVLAALALSVGSAVPVPRLIDLVWGDDPPRTAGKTLQSYVTRLRKSLGPASIVRSGSAYRLTIRGEAIDVIEFQQRLAAGDAAGALAIWTGPPLAGLDAPGLAAAVDGLIETWLGAVETDLEQRVSTDAASAVGPLTELTGNYPFREGLWALLMTALYRVGRQADALSAYQRARHHLVSELGVEPGPRLRALESLILDHDDALATAPGRKQQPAAAPALRDVADHPTGTVTFGFCELVGATPRWSSDREAATALLTRVGELVVATASAREGYVYSQSGDAFGVAFDWAGDAARWALDLQAAIVAEPWARVEAPRVRIGVHTGEAEEQRGAYFGAAVADTERLAAVGHGGQVLVSGTAAALIAGSDDIGAAALIDLGTYRLHSSAPARPVLQLGSGRFPPLLTGRSPRGNLPHRPGRLFGRDGDLAVVEAALAGSTVVTLVGPGGIGKTRLALAVAQSAGGELSGGRWLVELGGIASPDEVARAVASTLDVEEQPGLTLDESIVAALRAHPVLLVLDNCEHVIDGASALAQGIAEGCEDAKVLATSREGLGLAGEQLIAIGPLDAADAAVELFNERALAADHSFDTETNRPEVEEICRQLDGLPLAIELAAARVRSLSPADLVVRLDDHLRLLTGGRRTSVERHRTLRATIEWSHDLLSPPQRLLFQRLSVFAGPFDLRAAEAIATDNTLDAIDVDDLLGDLVERSMVIVESGPRGRRFRMLETMRQFAAEHLFERGDTDEIAERHARWCLGEVTTIGQLLASPDEIEGTARLDDVWPHLRAAFGWACDTGEVTVAHGLLHPIVTEVYVRSRTEIADWAERLLAVTPPDNTDLIVFGLIWAARRYMRHLDRDGYERLVTRYGEPDHPMMAYARAFIHTDFEGRATSAPLALAELRREGEHLAADLFEVAALAATLLLLGHLQEVETLGLQLVNRFGRNGPRTCLNWALGVLGYASSLQGRHREAWEHFNAMAQVELPARTHSLENPLEARAALQRGDRLAAFEALGNYLDEMLENDNLYLAVLACIEFVNTMAEIDHLAEADPVLDYLSRTGQLDATIIGSAIAPARSRLTTDLAPAPVGQQSEHQLLQTQPPEHEDRQVLRYMRDVVNRIADETRNHG